MPRGRALPRTHRRWSLGRTLFAGLLSGILFREKDSLETLPPDGIPGGRASLGKEEFPAKNGCIRMPQPFAQRVGPKDLAFIYYENDGGKENRNQIESSIE